MANSDAGAMALMALQELMGARNLGDYIYDIREREGQGWEGPKVRQWNNGCIHAEEALRMAGLNPIIPR